MFFAGYVLNNNDINNTNQMIGLRYKNGKDFGNTQIKHLGMNGLALDVMQNYK